MNDIYFYIVREIFPELVILGVGFVLLGLVIATPLVVWKAAKHLVQGFRTPGSHLGLLVARCREQTSGANAGPRLVQASIVARAARRS
jgi:hypothetical protein